MFWLYALMAVLPAVAIYKTVTRLDDSSPSVTVGIMMSGLVFIIQVAMIWAGGVLWMTLAVLVFMLALLMIVAMWQERRDGLHQPLPMPHERTPGVPFTEIEFDYVDAKGDRSHRTVEVWAVDDEYFEGHCHKAHDTRTFVIGRIRGKVLVHDTGELLAPRQWVAQARRSPGNAGRVQGRTGLPKK